MEREATVMLMVVLALLATGVLIVYSVSAVKPGGAEVFRHHVAHVCIGLGIMAIASRFNYHWFQKRAVLRFMMVATFVLLVAVLIWGDPVRGARRWIRVAGFQFQPSELAKVAVVIFLALKMSVNQKSIQTFRQGFVPPLLTALFFSALILAEPDLGVPIVILATTFAMMFVAGVRTRYLLASAVPVLGGVLFLVVAYPYRIERVLAWLNPWAYSKTKGFHLIQSLAAFARGSLWGMGAGAGEQKLQYLPDAHTDFIFAVVGEEMGLAGTLATMALFFVLMVMAMRVAKCAPDLFGSLLAVGITGLIAFQALFNVAVTTGLLPTKGLPLPFISCGGTAIVVFLGLVGILLNIASQAQEPQRQLVPAF
ncbi:MAG TPA: putative lipid II flippase FtsW [Candidatus Bathyarchaeia archaeon]|nr:putative lipid II flippase FtsW [Candidatus Bathyarchaeia archaeon]